MGAALRLIQQLTNQLTHVTHLTHLTHLTHHHPLTPLKHESDRPKITAVCYIYMYTYICIYIIFICSITLTTIPPPLHLLSFTFFKFVSSILLSLLISPQTYARSAVFAAILSHFTFSLNFCFFCFYFLPVFR